jgi:hypothetical protein
MFVVLSQLSTGQAEAATPAYDLSGEWEGHGHLTVGLNQGIEHGTCTLVQNGDRVTGLATTGGVVDAWYTGEKTLHFTYRNDTTLPNPYVGEGDVTMVSKDIGTVTFSGTDNNNTPVSGQGVMTRNRVSASAWLNLNKVKDLNTARIYGGFWAKVALPNIQSATVTTPQGETFPMSYDASDDDWEVGVDVPIAHLASRFPDGIYYFDILFGDGTRGTDFAFVEGEYPTGFPSFISPVLGATIDERLDLQVTWDAGVAHDSAYLSLGDFSVSLSGLATTTIVPASTFAAGQTYNIWLQFSGTPIHNCHKIMTASMDICTSGNRFTEFPNATLIKATYSSGVVFGGLSAQFCAVGVRSATITTPKNETIPLAFKANQGKWRCFAYSNTLDEAITRFPDGTYRFDVTFEDGTTTSTTTAISGPFPAYPVITSPANGQYRTPGEAFWIAWDPATIPADRLWGFWELEKTGTTPDDGETIWEEGILTGMTQSLVPAGVITETVNYELRMGVILKTGKGSMSMVSLHPNHAPVCATPIPDQTASTGTAFNFVASAATFTDPDSEPLIVTASGLPAWLVFDAATRTFSGTPGPGDAGTSTITVTVQDPYGANASDDFTVTVNAVAGPAPDSGGGGGGCGQGSGLTSVALLGWFLLLALNGRRRKT